MRSLMALLFLVMFCSLHLTTSAPLSPVMAKTDCCSTFSDAKIPLKRVKSYYWTGSNCPTRAIVFQTEKHKICVDPDTAWVNGHIATVDNRTTTTKATTQITDKGTTTTKATTQITAV